MKRSTDRILVSHVGSLARPRDLMEMLVARNEGKPFDAEALARRTREAVADVVEKQIDSPAAGNAPGTFQLLQQARYFERVLEALRGWNAVHS